MNFPIVEVSDIVAAGISIHGSGFDREAIVPSILVLVFFAWCMKGAPVNEKAQGGFTLGWIILIGFIIFGLLIPPESFGAAWPDYAPQMDEYHVDLSRPDPAPWNGIPITPIVIALALWFLIPEGKAKAKPKAKSEPKTDPMTEIVVNALRNGKKVLIPAVPILLFSAAVANAGMVGNLFESDGQEARRKAEAEAIQAQADIERLRAELDAERQRALLHSAGYRPDRNVVPMAVVFTVAVLAIILYWVEIRTRTAKEEEVRRLQVRLAVAESRRYREPGFGEPSALLALEERHGR